MVVLLKMDIVGRTSLSHKYMKQNIPHPMQPLMFFGFSLHAALVLKVHSNSVSAKSDEINTL